MKLVNCSSSAAGGMALQGNPWKCVCQNTWLARWLLRWMREALQLHTSVVERGQNIQSIVRTITCQTPVDPRSVTSVSHASSRQPPAAASSPSVHDTPPGQATNSILFCKLCRVKVGSLFGHDVYFFTIKQSRFASVVIDNVFRLLRLVWHTGWYPY